MLLERHNMASCADGLMYADNDDNYYEHHNVNDIK
jgi:hypothetical protein